VAARARAQKLLDDMEDAGEILQAAQEDAPPAINAAPRRFLNPIFNLLAQEVLEQTAKRGDARTRASFIRLLLRHEEMRVERMRYQRCTVEDFAQWYRELGPGKEILDRQFSLNMARIYDKLGLLMYGECWDDDPRDLLDGRIFYPPPMPPQESSEESDPEDEEFEDEELGEEEPEESDPGAAESPEEPGQPAPDSPENNGRANRPDEPPSDNGRAKPPAEPPANSPDEPHPPDTASDEPSPEMHQERGQPAPDSRESGTQSPEKPQRTSYPYGAVREGNRIIPLAPLTEEEARNTMEELKRDRKKRHGKW